MFIDIFVTKVDICKHHLNSDQVNDESILTSPAGKIITIIFNGPAITVTCRSLSGLMIWEHFLKY